MISYGANLGLMVNAATGEVHDVALRGFLRGVDGLVQPNIKGYLTNTPPGSPTDGDVYIIGAAPTGAWAGNAGKVARWYANGGTWDFYTPKNGWTLQSNSAREVYRYTGGAWEIFYQEGTWTPTWTSLTVVGSLTTSGTYIKSGRLCLFSVKVSATSTSSTGTGTNFNTPFTAGPSHIFQAVDLDNNADYGNGAGVTGTTSAYSPAWTTRPNVVCAGSFIIQ